MILPETLILEEESLEKNVWKTAVVRVQARKHTMRIV